MASIAVIVWASNYSGELKSLPACARDGSAIESIISKEPRFSEVLVIKNEPSSVVAMSIIADFFKKYGGKEIDEVFFYFSGHGESREDDFLYLLPGFKSSAKMSTSIVNSQLDDLVRSLNPRLFVKIVDACESGTQYIKDSNPLERIEKGRAGFRDVFFFSSSQSDEKSYLDAHLSYFTESIVKAIQEHPIEVVRYVNLLNAVADFFAVLDFQRPYVVQQGALDSVFCVASSDLKDSLQAYVRKLSSKTLNEGPKNETPSIMDLIKADAETYCSREEVMDAVRRIPDYFARMSLSEDLAGLYSFSTEVVAIDRVHNIQTVGEYVRANKGNRSWFAEATFGEEQYQKRVRREKYTGLFGSSSQLRRLAALTDNPDDYTLVPATRSVVNGLRHTTDTEVPTVVVVAASTFPNMPQARCYIVPVLSQTWILLAYCIIHFEASDWEKVKSVGIAEWVFDEVRLKDHSGFEALLNRVSDRFRSAIEAPIRARFSLSMPNTDQPMPDNVEIIGEVLSG